MGRKLICIGGAHSGCGKTTVAENLLRLLPGSWCAVKYTKTAFYTSVRPAPDAEDSKDTSRMREAGADGVVWVQSPETGLKEALSLALDMLPGCEGVMVEGNSPIEFLSPDIVIFVFGKDPGRIKPSASRALRKADLIIHQGDPRSVSAGGLPPLKGEVIRIDLKEADGFRMLKERVVEMLRGGTTEGLRERLLGRARGRTITCAAARKMAEEEGVPYRELGRIADELQIRITNCELGCF